jgi:ribose transport system permease protein
MSIARGFMLLINNDALALPDSFLVIGQSRFLSMQLPFWFALFIVIIFSILVGNFSFFKRYYYIGGNERAARLSGIPVDRMKIIAFVLSAILAGLAGILLTARMGGSMITFGQGMEMRVITAAILGGASLKGGVGVIPGAFLGTIFMALLSNLMIIAKVSVYWQQIIIGIILLIAVSVDVLLKKQAE